MAGKFFSTLRELRAGQTLEELDSAIAEVVAAVKATRKLGEIVFRIRICPPDKSTANYLVLEDEVKTKLPEFDRADTIFFPLADNSLSRTDPQQLQLGLRPVERNALPEVSDEAKRAAEAYFNTEHSST